jgi:hypothetical protein
MNTKAGDSLSAQTRTSSRERLRNQRGLRRVNVLSWAEHHSHWELHMENARPGRAVRIRDRLELARFLIARIAPDVKANGRRERPSAMQPGCWSYEVNGLQFVLAEKVLLRPDDAATSSSLDVWPQGGSKVFSVAWKPEQPWVPPEIACCKPGAWIEWLGFGRSS